MLPSLRRVLPDLDRLLADPAAALSRQDLRIPRRRSNPAVPALFVLILLVPVLAVAHLRLGLGLPMLVGGAIGFAAVGAVLLFLPYGTEIVLGADGARFRRGRHEVFCPWALFGVRGTAVLRASEAVLLPAAPEAVALVEQRQDGAVVARGAGVKSPLLKVVGGREILLEPGYDAYPGDVAKLLLRLGGALGARRPGGPVSPPAEPAPAARAPRPVAKKGGWITVGLTRWVLPPVCCDCGRPTSASITLATGCSVLRSGLTQNHPTSLRVPVPLCVPCWRVFRWRRWQGRVLGMATGLAVALAAFAVFVEQLPLAGQLGLAMGGTAAGLFFGYLLGTEVVNRRYMPAEVGGYAPEKGTVDVRFRNPEYTTRTLETLPQ